MEIFSMVKQSFMGGVSATSIFASGCQCCSYISRRINRGTLQKCRRVRRVGGSIVLNLDMPEYHGGKGDGTSPIPPHPSYQDRRLFSSSCLLRHLYCFDLLNFLLPLFWLSAPFCNSRFPGSLDCCMEGTGRRKI
ncbi:hypothetical protein GDO78_010086 [Eleutherodactylus coqui]|uniref:Uncharacterized protein n=1 Tax=Eleutherodactylus coqui TaxID=57060 RepID=A0A8J6KD73_ELECQ|nr:hypothetical protein GDO78_010086 [Eleutherodactylus coqui]